MWSGPAPAMRRHDSARNYKPWPITAPLFQGADGNEIRARMNPAVGGGEGQRHAGQRGGKPFPAINARTPAMYLRAQHAYQSALAPIRLRA
jgi:hypothetical protein